MQDESYRVFDPHTVPIQQHSQQCMAENDGFVDEMDYRTLLLLYDDARKVNEVLRSSVVIACRSGKFGNPEAAAKRIIDSQMGAL